MLIDCGWYLVLGVDDRVANAVRAMKGVHREEISGT